MSSALLIRDDSRRTLELTAEAQNRATNALESASLVGVVNNPEQQNAAVAVQCELKTLLSDIEKARVAAKQPVLDFGRMIDSASKAFMLPLEAEFDRVSRAVADFAALQEAQRKAEEAARRLEEQRLQRERDEEIRRQAQAELQEKLKLEAAEKEAQRQAAEAKNKIARAEAQKLAEELARQKQIAEAKSLEAVTQINERFAEQQAALPAAKEPARAESQIVKEIIVIDGLREFELMRARPDLVRKVEFDLIAIKKLLAEGVKLPGVTWHKDTQSTVRTGGRTQTLELARAPEAISEVPS